METTEKVLLEDDKKEFKWISISMLAVALGVTAFEIYNACANRSSLKGNISEIVSAVIAGLISCYFAYIVLDVIKYKVTVTDNSINVNSLFGNKTLEWSGNMTYRYKKTSSNHCTIKIMADYRQITVHTKKKQEMLRILQEHEAQPY